jgi:hypothetical protein
MIIVKIHGGLGNQLFQYAFGRNLAIKNKCELKLDLSFFDDQELRKYELDHFSITEKQATPVEIGTLKKKQFSKINTIRGKFMQPGRYFIEEKSLLFDPQYLKSTNNTYLSGYWQSEKYFSDAASQLKKEFVIKTLPSAANAEILDALKLSNAISIHIRRGDFQQDTHINKIHGTCSLSYYNDAANIIAGKVPDPVFYVFSDDIPWAMENLKINYNSRFVDINDESSGIGDLRLMYNCKHHIIANSTFSWWGAWLNPNPDKIIIAPKTWFSDPELNLQAKTIIPETWITI